MVGADKERLERAINRKILKGEEKMSGKDNSEEKNNNEDGQKKGYIAVEPAYKSLLKLCADLEKTKSEILVQELIEKHALEKHNLNLPTSDELEKQDVPN